jgi:hypothetical protein
MTAPAKALTFWAQCEANRRQPGNCSRCGRPNDLPPARAGRRGTCSLCRGHNRRAKERATAQAAHLHRDASFALELERRVSVLEARCQRFAKYAQNAYKAGWHQGQRAERKKWRNMPREFDAWQQPLDIVDKKQHFHRVSVAAEA